MDFIISLPLSIDEKIKSYDTIVIIIDYSIKMVYYNLVKTTIDTIDLVEVIIDVVVRHYGLLKSIISNKSFLFISKLWFLPYYFLDIKRKLSTTFYSQTNSKTKRQNRIIKAYLWAFVNQEQNDWPKLLPVVEFVYNNAKNVSTSYNLFELTYRYPTYISFEKKY